MEGRRSISCREGRNQIEIYTGNRPVPSGMQDLRSYSTYCTSSFSSAPQPELMKIKKGKISGGSSASLKNWSLNDPELQRKKRVAGYKAYSMEGKMKGSFRKSFRWIKDACTHAVYGWW